MGQEMKKISIRESDTLSYSVRRGQPAAAERKDTSARLPAC